MDLPLPPGQAGRTLSGKQAQAASAAALVGRIVGTDRASAFNLSIDAAAAGGPDSFTLHSGPCCTISGTNGVALASGFNWCVAGVVNAKSLPEQQQHPP